MIKTLEQIRLAIFKITLAKRHLLYVNGSEALPPPLSKRERERENMKDNNDKLSSLQITGICVLCHS